MNRRLLLASLTAAGLLTAAHASIVVPEMLVESASFSAPAPAMVVSPRDLPDRYRNATVRLSLTVDETGRPQDIAFARGRDPVLARKLFPVVAQWQFKPARRNGVPVSSRVVLPLHLAESADGPAQATVGLRSTRFLDRE